MRAYSWIALGTVAFACGGSAFTAENTDPGGDGGDASDAGSAGVLNRAGRGSGGSLIGSGGKLGKGGTSNNGGSSSGGVISVGGDLGIAGDLVVGGSPPVAGQPGTGGTAGTAGMTGMAGSGGTSPDPVDKVCPKLLPAQGGPCTSGLLCSYGTDVRTACRNTSKCSNGVWNLNKPVCEQLHGCSGAIVGNACDAGSAKPCLLNATDGIYCICTGCGNGGACTDQTVWACAAGDGAQGCPKLAPNEGQMCMGESTKCGYGSCSTGNGMRAVCDGTTWSWDGVLCAL